MKTQNLVVLVGVCVLVAGAFGPGAARAGQICDTDSGGPYVCVEKGGTLFENLDFNFDFSDPDYPDVQLKTGATDWRVWSQVSSGNTNPANLGDLTLDPSSADEDFEVTIKNGANAGAVDVKSINLSAASWSGYSLIESGSNISGNLEGVLTLAKDASDAGGTANFTIEGDVTGNVTMFNAAGLTIEGTLDGATFTAERIARGTLTFDELDTAVIDITNVIDDGTLDLKNLATASSIDVNEMDGSSSIDLASSLAGPYALDCGVIVRSDMPAGTSITTGNVLWNNGASLSRPTWGRTRPSGAIYPSIG